MLEICVGIIIDGDEIVLSKRAEHVHQGGKWEFPGGKVESSETAAKALVRECNEELGIEVIGAALVDQFEYSYPEKTLKFSVFVVDEFDGEPKGCEGQLVQRVHWRQLDDLEFPAANVRMVDWVKHYFTRCGESA